MHKDRLSEILKNSRSKQRFLRCMNLGPRHFLNVFVLSYFSSFKKVTKIINKLLRDTCFKILQPLIQLQLLYMCFFKIIVL